MKKSELLKAIREEILRHDLDAFMNPQHKIVRDRLFDVPKTLRDN